MEDLIGKDIPQIIGSIRSITEFNGAPLFGDEMIAAQQERTNRLLEHILIRLEMLILEVKERL